MKSKSGSQKVYPAHTRWQTFVGTLLAQFALGSVYTWSLFNAPFASKLHSTIPNVAFTLHTVKNGYENRGYSIVQR